MGESKAVYLEVVVKIGNSASAASSAISEFASSASSGCTSKIAILLVKSRIDEADEANLENADEANLP